MNTPTYPKVSIQRHYFQKQNGETRMHLKLGTNIRIKIQGKYYLFGFIEDHAFKVDQEKNIDDVAKAIGNFHRDVYIITHNYQAIPIHFSRGRINIDPQQDDEIDRIKTMTRFD